MVARNAWASNSRPFLEVRRGGAELRILLDVESAGVLRANFFELMGLRGEPMGAPPLSPYYTALAALGYSGSRECFTLSNPDMNPRSGVDGFEQIVLTRNAKEKRLLVSRLIRFDHTEALVSDQREHQSVLLANESSGRIIGRFLWWTGKAR